MPGEGRQKMTKHEINRTRAGINSLRARYGAGETTLTDDQIAEGVEHYRPKASVDILVVDEMGDMDGLDRFDGTEVR